MTQLTPQQATYVNSLQGSITRLQAMAKSIVWVSTREQIETELGIMQGNVSGLLGSGSESTAVASLKETAREAKP